MLTTFSPRHVSRQNLGRPLRILLLKPRCWVQCCHWAVASSTSTTQFALHYVEDYCSSVYFANTSLALDLSESWSVCSLPQSMAKVSSHIQPTDPRLAQGEGYANEYQSGWEPGSLSIPSPVSDFFPYSVIAMSRWALWTYMSAVKVYSPQNPQRAIHNQTRPSYLNEYGKTTFLCFWGWTYTLPLVILCHILSKLNLSSICVCVSLSPIVLPGYTPQYLSQMKSRSSRNFQQMEILSLLGWINCLWVRTCTRTARVNVHTTYNPSYLQCMMLDLYESCYNY